MIGKDERDRGHAAGLNYKQQAPPVAKGHQRMQRVAEINVLSAGFMALRRKFRVDEGAGQRNQTTDGPGSQNEQRRVYLLRDNVGICEDARADDSSHYD